MLINATINWVGRKFVFITDWNNSDWLCSFYMSIATLKNEAELNDSGSVFVICGRFRKGTDGKKKRADLKWKKGSVSHCYEQFSERTLVQLAACAVCVSQPAVNNDTATDWYCSDVSSTALLFPHSWLLSQELHHFREQMEALQISLQKTPIFRRQVSSQSYGICMFIYVRARKHTHLHARRMNLFRFH